MELPLCKNDSLIAKLVDFCKLTVKSVPLFSFDGFGVHMRMNLSRFGSNINYMLFLRCENKHHASIY